LASFFSESEPWAPNRYLPWPTSSMDQNAEPIEPLPPGAGRHPNHEQVNDHWSVPMLGRGGERARQTGIAPVSPDSPHQRDRQGRPNQDTTGHDWLISFHKQGEHGDHSSTLPTSRGKIVVKQLFSWKAFHQFPGNWHGSCF
jgi:hypothetical protein